MACRHYLNQCWNIVNWILRNKFQWNFNRYSNIFIPENAFENVVCEMASILSWPQCVNTLTARQNGHQFPDNNFKFIVLNKNIQILIKISLKGPINNIPTLVQIMAWRQPCDKPLSEPIETVSADGRSARPARLGGHPIWWRWHGNTKNLSKVQSSDV